eukprot:118737-Prymnesium_polylepis.1
MVRDGPAYVRIEGVTDANRGKQRLGARRALALRSARRFGPPDPSASVERAVRDDMAVGGKPH